MSRVSKTSINVRLTDQHKCHSHLMENVALHYRIEHASHVDYSKVDPVYCEVEGFGIRIEDNRVRFEMKEHYATVDSALEAVKPYIHSWELDAALRSQPGEFKLKFCGAEVEDRKPIPGKHEVSADPVFWEFSTSVPTVTKYLSQASMKCLQTRCFGSSVPLFPPSPSTDRIPNLRTEYLLNSMMTCGLCLLDLRITSLGRNRRESHTSV